MLSADLKVRAQTPETEQFLRVLVPPDDDRPPIPAAAYNVGAQLLAVENGVDDHPPVARVNLEGSSWLTIRAARIDDGVAVIDEAADIIWATNSAESFCMHRRRVRLRVERSMEYLTRRSRRRSLYTSLHRTIAVAGASAAVTRHYARHRYEHSSTSHPGPLSNILAASARTASSSRWCLALLAHPDAASCA